MRRRSIARHLRHGPVYLGAVLLFLALQVAFAWSQHVLLTGAILFAIGIAQAGFQRGDQGEGGVHGGVARSVATSGRGGGGSEGMIHGARSTRSGRWTLNDVRIDLTTSGLTPSDRPLVAS